MRSTVRMLDGLPSLKANIQSKMSQWQEKREEKSAEDGIAAALKAR
jgi:hypothetical protein